MNITEDPFAKNEDSSSKLYEQNDRKTDDEVIPNPWEDHSEHFNNYIKLINRFKYLKYPK